MALTINPEAILGALNKEIESQVRQAVEETAEEAAERARQAVRKKVGEIVASVVDEYDVAMQGQRLVITVKLRDSK